jgi:hemerythrin-like domain-containing protein
MKAVAILKEEHRQILWFLDQLSLASERIVKSENPPRKFFDEAITFAHQYADKFHHYKEEEIMFRILAQKHDGALDAELDQLKQQHVQCRNFVSAIADALDGYESGSQTETRVLHRNLQEYIKSLRKHIDHENIRFFPKVGQELSASELKMLEGEFDRWEAKMGGAVNLENDHRLRVMSSLLQPGLKV